MISILTVFQRSVFGRAGPHGSTAGRWGLRMHGALAGLSLAPNAHVRKPTASYNPSSRRSEDLSWTLGAPAYTYAHTYLQTIWKHII